MKYAALALAVALVGGGGYFAYDKFLGQPLEDDEPVVQQPKKEKVVEKSKKVEKNTDDSLDLTGLDEVANKPVKRLQNQLNL